MVLSPPRSTLLIVHQPLEDISMEKTTDLSDANPDAPVLPPIFRDFGGRLQFEGPALTVSCFEDNSRIKELSLTPGNGRVLVVDGGGSVRCALLGDIIAMDLVKNGWAGAIVDGCVRDAAILSTLGLGVKARAAHSRKSLKRNEGAVGQPIVVGGVRIATGDRICADEDGVIVLSLDKHPQAQ
jgi:regulator of ribonuclease activity A